MSFAFLKSDRLWTALLLGLIFIQVVIFAQKSSRPFQLPLVAWAGERGLMYQTVENDKRIIQHLTLKAKDGSELPYPLFAFDGKRFVYWSLNENQLCVITSGKKEWHPVKLFEKDLLVSDIQLLGDDVILNLFRIKSREGIEFVKAIRFDLQTNSTTPIDHALCVRSQGGAENYAVLTDRKGFEVRSAGKKVITYPALTIDKDLWDYEPESDTVYCISKDRTLTLFSKGKKRKVSLGFTVSRGVQIIKNESLILVNRFSTSFDDSKRKRNRPEYLVFLDAYQLDTGDFLGTVVEHSDEQDIPGLDAPYFVNEQAREMIDFLKNHLETH